MKITSDIISTVNLWSLGMPGKTLKTTTHNVAGYQLHSSISFAKLRTYHPSLPESLESLLKWKLDDRGVVYATRDEVTATLGILKHQGPTFVDLGTTPCFLTSMQYANIKEDVVEFFGNVYVVETTLKDGKSISFAGYPSDRRIFVSSSELDSRYPNWRNRHHLGSELGLAGSDLMNYLFYPSPVVQTPDMNGITFDVTDIDYKP